MKFLIDLPVLYMNLTLFLTGGDVIPSHFDVIYISVKEDTKIILKGYTFCGAESIVNFVSFPEGARPLFFNIHPTARYPIPLS